MIFAWSYAEPRDLDGKYKDSLNKDWFEHLASKKGPCCSYADGQVIADPDWESKDGHYRVYIEGQWYDVPESALINEPNRIGRTMVWPYKGPIGIEIKCFMPGVMM